MEYEDAVTEIAEQLHVPEEIAEAMAAQYGQALDTYEDVLKAVRWIKRQQRRARKRRW